MKIGVLAVQGDFNLHKQTLIRLGVDVVEVRRPDQLNNLDGIIIPGGESTTFHIVMECDNLGEVLRSRLADGLPVWGTCAGSIILGRGTDIPQPRWELIDIEVVRNAYGRQVDSFVAPLDIDGLDSPFMGVFIRAPRFQHIGASVQTLAMWNDETVMAHQGSILLTSFHPELTDDTRIHHYFITQLCQ